MTSLVLAGVLAIGFPGPSEDAVASFPGYGVPKTPHWSGFLNASAAEPGTFLHYWLASYTGDGDADKAPVVLWLNGGPGASSVFGLLQETGPLIIDNTGKLMDNPYAWTEVANVLALESPAGVGYSYCAAMMSGGSCSNTDDSTSSAAYEALIQFFHHKFPSLAANPFFITGESYAGVYCPTLADRIVKGNDAGRPKINLAGMAVGDPCTDTPSQTQSMDMLWYAHKNGLVQDHEYEYLSNTCGASVPSARMAGSWVAISDPAAREDGASRKPSLDRSARATPTRVVPDPPPRARFAAGAPPSANCSAALRRFLIGSSKGISQNWAKGFINELSFYSPAATFRFDLPGTLNYHTAQWMMSKEVRAALHVEHAPVTSWPGPTAGWKYTSLYNACNDKPVHKQSMVDFYRSLAPRLQRIVVYNGDTDPCVSYEGTRIAIEKVGFQEVAPYRPWFFNFSAASQTVLEKKDLLFGPSLSLQSGGAQYGGSIVDYEHGLSFATVHGSGHMVPTFRPRAGLQMLEHVVRGTPFAPPVLSDAALAAMGDDEFDDYLDRWVGTARSAEYVHQGLHADTTSLHGEE